MTGEPQKIKTASRVDEKRHRAAIRLIDSLPPGKALDLGSGGGDFARMVADRGYLVMGCDFVVPLDTRGVKFVRLDLNRPLPFRRDSFDLLSVLEVIEHLADPSAFLKELNRLLKPGGKMILSLPNKLQVRSRVRFLLSGLYKGLKLPIESYKPAPRQHVMVLSYLELRYFLEVAGFRIERVAMSRLKAISLLYLTLLGIPIALYTAMVLGLNPKVRDRERRAYNRSVMRGLLSLPTLLSEDLLLIAGKETAGSQ